MAEQLSEKQAKTLYDRIQRAIRFGEKEVLPNLKRAARLYGGEHWPDMDQTCAGPRVVVNYMWPTVETKVSNIAFSYPDFRLKPLNDLGQASVDVATHVLAYDWRMAGAQVEARRALRDCEIYALGIIHDFWLFETEPAGDGEPGVREEGGRPAAVVEPTDTTPDTFPETESAAAPGEKVRSDRPGVKRIAPSRFFVDLECDSQLANAAYCGFWEYRPLDEVKRDKRYSNTKNLNGSGAGMQPWCDDELREMDADQLPPDCKRVKLFHYFEARSKMHYVFCDEHKKALMSEPWRWEGDWYPFAILRAADDEDKFWPTPPLIRIEHQQQEINESRTQHSDWRRQSVPKYQVVGGTLQPDQRGAVSSSRAGTIAENLPVAVTPIPHAPLQPQVLEAGTLALQDLQFIAGLNDYETATPPTKRVTSTEVQAIREGGGSRGAADRQAFEMFCAVIAEHMLAREQQYSVRSRQIPIFDRDENVTGFQDYTREQIAGRFLVEVYVGSTTAPSPQDTLQGVAFAMQSLTPLLQTIPVADQMGINLRPLIPRLLKAALPEIRDIESLLQPQAPQGLPMAAPGGMPAPMAGPPQEGGMPAEGAAPAASPESALAQLAALQAGQGA